MQDGIGNSLSDERLKQLFLEESVRSDIRKQLSPPAQRKPFIWEFLNSTFGIFLLSSVLITGVARLYTDYQARAAAISLRNQELATLATEFDYRTRLIEYYYSRLTDPNLPEEERAGHGVMVWQTVVGDPTYYPTLPEFENLHWMGMATKMGLIFPEVSVSGVQEAIFSIENGKDRNWIYDPALLSSNIGVIRTYINQVITIYSERLAPPSSYYNAIGDL